MSSHFSSTSSLYYRKMDWTEEHDIILLREALAQDPYSYKTRSRERGKVLQSIADVLNNMQQSQFKVTSRSIRDHLNALLSKFKSKTNKELKASGFEVQNHRLNALLEEVFSAKTEYDIKFIEDNKNCTEAVQNRSMEILSETKKREAAEPKTKRG